MINVNYIDGFSIATRHGRAEYTLQAGDIWQDSTHLRVPEAGMLQAETVDSVKVDLLGLEPPPDRECEIEKYIGQILADLGEDSSDS